jgi:hypothetical protein
MQRFAPIPQLKARSLAETDVLLMYFLGKKCGILGKVQFATD